MLRRLLSHPLTRGLDIDDPLTTALRRDVIATKPFLRRVMQDWYRLLAAAVPAGDGHVLELGSGAGFLKEVIPEVITSEVFPDVGVDRVVRAEALPFRDGELRAVVMADVFHHIPDVGRFLSEAERCLRPGGVVAMVEPWVTAWSRFVYTRLHHEPFEPQAAAWRFASSGALSGANSALPWIVFQRDREMLSREHPRLVVDEIRPFMPLRFLIAGGISLRSLAPGWAYGAWGLVERLLSPLDHRLAMFALIQVRRIPEEEE